MLEDPILMVVVVAFVFVSDRLRKRFLKPVPREQAQAELEERLRTIERDRYR